jgi:hypothetical protein
MKSFMVALLLICISSNFALAQRAQVYTFKVTLGEDTVELPQVKMADATVQQRINYFIQAKVFDLISPPNYLRTAIRSKLWTESNPGMTTLGYQVIRNDSRLLTINAYAEGMGAHPGSSWIQMTFNIQSGLPVEGRDIFTKKGYEDITSRILSKRMALVLVNNQELSKDTSGDVDSTDRVQIENDLIRCAKDTANATMNDLLISDSMVTVDPTSCLGYAAHAFDIDWNVSFSIDSLRQYLNAYGKGLILGQQYQPRAGTTSKYELLKGAIDGKYPIVMILHDYDFDYDGGDEVGGCYFYSKKGTPIGISGKRTGSSLDLTEENDTGEPFAGFSGEYSNGTYKGIWRSAKGDKKLKFELSRY